MSPVLLALLVLLSGTFHSTLAVNRLRNFTFLPRDRANWMDAKSECSKINQSLVTVYDEEDIQFVHRFAKDLEVGPWLGLRRAVRNVSTWSDGVPVTFNESTANVKNGQQRCEAIDDNTWKDFSCSDRKYFMCYRGSNYSLIENKMNWCQAQHYCRKHFADLVSISNTTQNEHVIREGRNKTFWIGLMHDEWKWDDKGCSTYREWHTFRSQNECTQNYDAKLHEQDCTNDQPILCSTGAVRIKVIKRDATWEQAFDYCRAHHSRLLQVEDEHDQQCVEQWLRYVYPENANATYWMGLRQSRVFGFWIWSDKPVLYDNWSNNNTIPEMPMSENCGVIKTDDYTWRDENCWHPHKFLCEEDLLYM